MLERLGRALDSPWALLILALPIAALTWPQLQVAPVFGIDSGWATGMSLGYQQGLDAGTELIYQVGPLGFLQQPSIVDSKLAVIAAIYTVGARYVLALTLLWAASRSLPLPFALVVAYVAALVTPQAGITVAFIWCVVAASDDAPGFARPVVIYGGSALAVMELLGRADVGVLVTALCVVSILATKTRWRDLLIFAGCFAGFFALAWIFTGQGIGNIDDFVRGAYEESSGYSSALLLQNPHVPWDIYAAAGLIAAAFAASYLGTRTMETQKRVAILAMTAILCFIEFKHGFVRHEPGHVARFGASMLAPWFAFRWQGVQRYVFPVAVASVVAVYFATTGFLIGPTFKPGDRVRGAFEQTRALVDPAERNELRSYARYLLVLTYDLDPKTRALLAERTVHVDPLEVNLAWAYGLDWDPIPVFQPLSAYTPYLDHRDASFLLSEDAPERILRHRTSTQANLPIKPYFQPDVSLDGRFAPWDQPAATLATLCGYQDLHTTENYQVLGRIEDRCGEQRQIGSVTAQYGEPIAVPARRGNEVILAKIDGLSPALERVRTTLYRGVRRYVTIGAETYVVIPALAGDGLILRAPPAIDYPRPWNLAPDTGEITFTKDISFGSIGGDLHVRFYAMPISPRSVPR